ncbi:MAG: 23S rRNA (adenine(2503)-C(2))-methyltransferase RlmN [Holophagaceae bacterium]|nr:23S rRNA (adenine(2503)-C(2))-methyltransferase RlmN [Holophagaceae bacterium]
MTSWDREAPEIGASFLNLLNSNAAGMGLEGFQSLFHGLGEPSYRALQAFEGIYKNRWHSWDQFSNLPKGLREKLTSALLIKWPELEQSKVSTDGSTKHAAKLADGKYVECVYIPYENRATMCISSQVGCAMGCTFCATGRMGLIRNLTVAEIVGQVMAMATRHRHPKELPLNIVMMGMGEPLHNLGHVLGAFAILIHPRGLSVPPWRITISTSGLVPGILTLGERSPRPRLALSLNATTDESRSRIMPVNSVWGLAELANALRSFPLGTGERVTLEYVVIKGFSDGMDDSERLSVFASQFSSKINLIPYNPCAGPEFEPPEEKMLNEMGRCLAERGHIVSIRRSRGQDVGGACGQLTMANYCHLS